MSSGDLLRTGFILMVAANFLFASQLRVSLPLLADMRRMGGAAAYGTIMGAFGGNLLGIVLAENLLHGLNERISTFMVRVISSFVKVLGLLGVINAAPLAFMVLLIMGTGMEPPQAFSSPLCSARRPRRYSGV